MTSAETVKPRESVAALLVLTFSTGIADAVGYLGLDKVFTGNMTGNVVILGMGASGAADLPVLGPALALAAFLAGAATGGRATRGLPSGWTPTASVLLACVGLTFAAVAIRLAAAPSKSVVLLTSVLAAAMGLQAAVARKIGEKDLSTVVVTSTVTGLAADSWIAGRTGQPWPRRIGAVVLICAGASCGALLIRAGLWAGAAVPAVLTLLVAAVPRVLARVRGRRIELSEEPVPSR